MFHTNLAFKDDEELPEYHNCAFDDRLICYVQRCQGCKIASRDLPVLPSVVMGHIFTYDLQAFLVQRADGVSIGPITGGCKFAENYVQALAREIKEEAGLHVKNHQIIKAEKEFVTFTPTSGKRIKIANFSVFLPEDFNPAKDVKLNGELRGYRILGLREAAKFLSVNALQETQKAFELITGY